MSPIRVAFIVTGHSEERSMPLLVHRIADIVVPGVVIDTSITSRVRESSLLRAGSTELERDVELTSRRLRGPGGILVLLDCDRDDGCPAREGPALLARARNVRSDRPIAVILARQETECWFLAAAESLRGKCGLSGALVAPPAPETIRGAKEWLSRHMPPRQPYMSVVHQIELARSMDLNLAASRSPSFAKFHRDVVGMLGTLSSVSSDFSP